MRSESKKTSNTNQRASNTATLLSENDAGEGVLLEKPIGLLTGHKERREGHMKDAWALGGDEGRDKLRKAAGRSKYPVIRGCPNGATRRGRPRHHP